MSRIAALLAVLLLAACSSDPATEPNGARDLGGADATLPSDSGVPAADVGADTTSEPDVALEGDVGTADMADVGVDATPGDMAMAAGDPYAPGPLAVAESAVDADDGPGVDVAVFAPTAAGRYPVIVFQHGFLLRNRYYGDLLTHVASHGFVVVAPQMYEPSFIGAPTTAEEAVAARTLYDWVIAEIDAVVPVEADATRLGLAGHSRGAKVLWLALEAGAPGVTAAAGLDPVDGTGGPIGGQARVLDGGLAAAVPSLIVGAELSAELVFGQACAPPGDDHAAFYAAAPAPAYWAFAEGYGHLDMLDDDTSGCGLICTACAEGPADGGMRRFSAGQLVAFFRWQLHGDAAAQALLTDEQAAPIAVQFQNK